MLGEVLRCYGYHTGAWGKWHNTPAEQTTAAGPFDYWPTGYGFEYFYGFLAGEAKIEVTTAYALKKPAGPLDITLKVNIKEVAKGTVPVSAPLLFTANDCLDIGIALGSPVSPDYFDLARFKFNGTIEQVRVKYTK